MEQTSWTRASRAAMALAVGLVAALGFTGSAQAAVPNRVAWVLYDGVSVVPSGTTPAGTVVALGPVGRYKVTFPGQAITQGIPHVTAVNNAPHWCQVESWGPVGADEVVFVRCYRPGGVLDWSGFSLFFTHSSGAGAGGPYGYVDAAAGGGVISQYNSAGGVNTSVLGPPGQYQVAFPMLGTGGPRDGSLQATAVNAAIGVFCNVATWSSTPFQQQAIVRCYNAAGAGTNTRFTLSYQHKTSLYGAALPPKYFGYTWWAPGAGPATTNFNSVGGLGVNTTVVSGAGLTMTTFPRIGFVPDNVQVTATGTVPIFCGLTNPWFHNTNPDIIVRNVNCFTVNGAPATNGHLISANSRI
jgi:hypothetical protein